jgi:CSLREA domain-containing protein
MSVQYTSPGGRHLIRLAVLVSLLASLSLLIALPVQAASITVNTLVDENVANAVCSLREAIIAANTNAAYRGCSAGNGADVITFIVSGEILQTYTLSTPTSEMTIDGAGNITLNGNDMYPMFYIGGSASGPVTLRGLRMINGFGAGDGNGLGSGAIHNVGTTLTLINSSISSSTATYGGGGIYNYLGNLTLINSTIFDNFAPQGGGIHNYQGTVTLTDSSVSGNLSGNRGMFHDGGGIYNDNGTVTLTNSTVSNNNAGDQLGGGIFTKGGTLTLTSSTLSGNSAAFGGGLHNEGSTVTLDKSTLSGNSAVYARGGGINTYLGHITVINSTLTGNTAYVDGGGIYNLVSEVDLKNSTVSGNSARSGGGINNAGQMNLGNSIIANSPTGGDCINTGAGFITPSGGNLIEDGSCGVAGAHSGDPLLGVLMGNPAYFPLLAGSLAIDTGDNSICPPTDQRGTLRPQDGDGRLGRDCDLGSFEARQPLGDQPIPLPTKPVIVLPTFIVLTQPVIEPPSLTVVPPTLIVPTQPIIMITIPPTATPTPTNLPSSTPTNTLAPTNTLTVTPTNTPTATPELTNTPLVKATDPPIMITATLEIK